MQLAEEDQAKYHAPGKFDAENWKNSSERRKFTSKISRCFGHTLVELAKQNRKIIGITPAMPTGSSIEIYDGSFPNAPLTLELRNNMPLPWLEWQHKEWLFLQYLFHFLQRAYDQVIHDVALPKFTCYFCLDRAGLVGEDGLHITVFF